jgi:hypothetical protein
VSAEHREPRDEHSIAQDLLKRLEHVRFDAGFREILELARAAQGEIDRLSECTWPVINDHTERVRTAWEDSGWNGTPVTVSGKLRPSGLSEITGDADLEGHEFRYDERGAYYQVDALTMSALGIAVDTHPGGDDLADYHAVVFSMTRVDEYDDDLCGEDGVFIMHPDDIVAIEFRDLSVNAAEHNLKYYFPEIYTQIRKYFSHELVSDRMITHALKRLDVACDDPNRHGYDLIESLNLYIFSHIDFDSMGYQVNFDGEIAALSASDELIEVYPPSHRYGRLSPATICGIIMQPTEDDTYRPSLIVAVPTPQQRGGYEAYIVPAESLMDVRSLRPRQSQLGQIASYRFDDPEDVALYFSGKGQLFREELAGTPTDDSDEERFIPEFVRIAEAERGNIAQIVAYNEREGHYFLSLEDDIARIIRDYDKIVGELGDDTDELDDSACRDACVAMMGSLEKLSSLKIGDMVVTAGATVAIDTEDGEQVSYILDNGEYVTGRFCGFAISQSPDLVMKITAGEAGLTTRDIALLIEHVELRDKEGVLQDVSFVDEQITLPVNRDGEQTVFKMVRE